MSYGNISFNIFIQYKTKQTDQIETGGGSVLKKPLRGDCSTNLTPFFFVLEINDFYGGGGGNRVNSFEIVDLIVKILINKTPQDK